MNQPTTATYFKTPGGGQFFKKDGDALTVVCLYDFNPCIERMKFSSDILQSLKCTECSKEEFVFARDLAIHALITGKPMPAQRIEPSPVEALLLE